MKVRRIPKLAGLVGVGFVLASCGGKHPLSTWDPKGTYARKIDNLQEPIFAIAGVVMVLVTVAIVMVIVKFRERPDHQAMPKQLHGNSKLEVAWTIAPAVLLAVIAFPTIKTIFDIARKPAADSLEVRVIGQQWWWEFDYSSGDAAGIVTSGEMVIPAGVPVRLAITSRDVIHSFWIPALNGKKDAVPGRTHPLTIQADKPGEFWGQCTEFCGLSHANMRMKVVALNQVDYAAWLANQRKTAAPQTDVNTAAGRGEALFAANCSRCHSVNGLQGSDGKAIISQPDQQEVSGAAPNLTHLMSRTTFAGAIFELQSESCQAARENTPSETYGQAYLAGTTEACLNRPQLEAWIRNAPAQKPMYSKLNKDKLYRGMPNLNLSEAQIDDLVAYLVTLK